MLTGFRDLLGQQLRREKRLKILLINHTFSDTDGQGKVNSSLARQLLDEGHFVTVVGVDIPETVSKQRNCNCVPCTPAQYIPTRLLRHLTFGWRTMKLIRLLGLDHDLVIANGGITFAPTDINICHFVHASWIRSPHHPRNSASRVSRLWGWYQYAYSKQAILWERNAYQRARSVVAISHLIKEQLIQDVGVEPEKITVIENGMGTTAGPTEAGRSAARGKMGVDDGQFVVLFAGDLKTPRKNFDILLAALQHLPAEIVVVAAGAHEDGPYPQLAKQLGVEDRVRFLGMRTDLLNLYSGADIFSLLSHYEPFGLVVTEALSAGVPVVTASTVGASDVVRRHECGIVLEDPTDVAAVAAALRLLFDNPEMRQKMGNNGNKVGEELAWPKVAKRYIDLLQQVATSR